MISAVSVSFYTVLNIQFRRLTGCDWGFFYLNIQKSFLLVPDIY